VDGDPPAETLRPGAGVHHRQVAAARLEEGHGQDVGLECPATVMEHLAKQFASALRSGERGDGGGQPGQLLGGAAFPVVRRPQFRVGLFEFPGPGEQVGLGAQHSFGQVRVGVQVRRGVVAGSDVVGDVVCAVDQQGDVVVLPEHRHGAVAPEPFLAATVGRRDDVPLDRERVRATGVARVLEGASELGPSFGPRAARIVRR
jgi:hypothetical protein